MKWLLRRPAFVGATSGPRGVSSLGTLPWHQENLMHTTTTEIASDVFRRSTFVPDRRETKHSPRPLFRIQSVALSFHANVALSHR
jgi:hypothetical protein